MAEYKQHQIQMAAEDIENVLQTSAKLVTNSDTKLTEEEKELIKNNLDISELNGLSSLEIGEYAKVEENSAFENEAYNAFAQGSKRDKSGAPKGTSRDTQAFAPSSMAAGMGAIAYSRASKSMGYRTQTGTPLSEEEYNRHFYIDEQGKEKNDIVRATDDKGNILYQNVDAEKPLDDNYNIGQAAAAFGSDTAAVANNAFAQGNKTQALGQNSHAEGNTTVASGKAAHSEGYGSKAFGNNSHAEGYYSVTKGHASHAEGDSTIANKNNQHVQGRYNLEDTASNDSDYAYAHIVGNGDVDARSNAHTLDWYGNAWFAGNVYVGSTSGTNKDEGSVKLVTTKELSKAYVTAGRKANTIPGSNSTAEGSSNTASASYSHAEGSGVIAEGGNSHAEGNHTWAKNAQAHAEGGGTIASGANSHAEGNGSIIIKNISGNNTTFTLKEANNQIQAGQYIKYNYKITTITSYDSKTKTIVVKDSLTSSAITDATMIILFSEAYGPASHVEGQTTKAIGTASHAEGIGTIASKNYQHVQGKYNIEDTTTNGYAHIVGNGTVTTPSNAHTLDWDGNAWYAGNVTAEKAIHTHDGVYADGILQASQLKIIGQSDEAVSVEGSAIIENDLIIKGVSTFNGDVNVVGDSFNAKNITADTLTVTGQIRSGSNTTATGTNATAQGKKTAALGDNSHAEGGNLNYKGQEYGAKSFSFVDPDGVSKTITVNGSEAYGIQSHAEGSQTLAYGLNSHAEGHGALASGHESHAEGHQCQATGLHSHAEGHLTVAAGINSHAQGSGTVANGRGQSVWGYYNIPDTYTDDDGYGKYIHIVGNGRYEWDRPSNAHTLDWSGNAWFAGNMECNALILKSPNGTRYKITVSDDGKLNTPVKL